MSHTFRMSYYEYARKHYRLREDAVFIDSHASSDLGGNLYYIARQIVSGRYGKFKLYISKGLRTPSAECTIIAERVSVRWD